jgi:hypothetical protein
MTACHVVDAGSNPAQRRSSLLLAKGANPRFTVHPINSMNLYLLQTANITHRQKFMTTFVALL